MVVNSANGNSLELPEDDTFFEKKISSLIEMQFPAVHREEAPFLVAFIKAYYQWMESQNETAYHTRRLYEYRDVDLTFDEFLVFFKEKYLKNINIKTVTSIRTLIKHSLDIYRSKGTERALELLFRAVFGVDIRIYYPYTDIFRPSDGVWKIPQYIEVAIKDTNHMLQGKQIVGLISGATAFVDNVIRRSIENMGFVDVLYISSIKGVFIAGEQLNTTE